MSGDRASAGKAEQTTFPVIDAQSVKNADLAEPKGYDAGKKVSGIKRHFAVDSRGLPTCFHVATAKLSDKAGAREMIQARAEQLEKVEALLVDGGYGGKPFAQFVMERIGATVEAAKRSEPHTFAVIPER